MLSHHPDLSQHAVGSARVFGQIAFAHASAGRRAEAMRWAMRASRRHPLEWRAVAASIVSTRLITGDRFLEILHRFGRGLTTSGTWTSVRCSTSGTESSRLRPRRPRPTAKKTSTSNRNTKASWKRTM